MKANLKKSKENVGKWSRWIGGGALVLALAGQLVPATASAMIDIGEEVIEIEGTTPLGLRRTGAAIRGEARRTVRRVGTVEAEVEVEAGVSPAGGAAVQSPHQSPRQQRNG